MEAHGPAQLDFFRTTIFRPLGVLSHQIITSPTTPKLYFQSDMGRRVASSWALPHISSFSVFHVL